MTYARPLENCSSSLSTRSGLLVHIWRQHVGRVLTEAQLQNTQSEYCVRCGYFMSSINRSHNCERVRVHPNHRRPPPLPPQLELPQNPPAPAIPTQPVDQTQAPMLVEVLPQLANLTLTPPPQTLAHEAAQPQQQRKYHFARPSRAVPFAAREQWGRSVRRACV